jgi:hypothetical protein
MFLTIAACRAPDLVPLTSLTNLTASLVDSRRSVGQHGPGPETLVGRDHQQPTPHRRLQRVPLVAQQSDLVRASISLALAPERSGRMRTRTRYFPEMLCSDGGESP